MSSTKGQQRIVPPNAEEVYSRRSIDLKFIKLAGALLPVMHSAHSKKGYIMKKLFALIAIAMSTIMATAASIPAGTRVTVRMGSELSSGKAHAGETWHGTLAKDVVVNGQTVARSGSEVTGKVTNAKSSGRLHAPGQLTLRLTSINGQHVSSSAYYRKGKSHTKSNATKIGGGAAAGAVIGAIAGGGKGAAIGTVAGAGAGTGVAAATGKEEATIPAETVMTFTITGSK
jgi:hypothetical protein